MIKQSTDNGSSLERGNALTAEDAVSLVVILARLANTYLRKTH